VEAAIETLKDEGLRNKRSSNLRTCGLNQALIFYHFGSVVNLLLAALDSVSNDRMVKFSAAINMFLRRPISRISLLKFSEMTSTRHVTVLAEMIAGASSVEGLGVEVATRLSHGSHLPKRQLKSPLATLH